MARSPDVVRLSFAIFVVAWGTNVSTPFLVLYQERLSLTNSATVGIFVVYVLGILGALAMAGPLSDRLGRKPVALPFTAASGLASLILLAGRDTLLVLLGGRLLLGIVSGAVIGVAAAWMLELFDEGNELKAAITTTLVTYFGFGFGPATSSLYERYFDHPLVGPFLIHAGVTVVALPLLWQVRETHSRNPNAPIRLKLGVPANSRKAFGLVIVPAAIWVFAFPSTAFALFPVLLSDALGSSKVLLAGASGTLTAWAGFVARPLVNRIGAHRALTAGMAMGITGYLGGTIAFGSGWWVLLLPAAGLLGAASGTLSAGCLTLLGAISDDDNRGKVTSTFYLLAYPGMAMPLLITTLGRVVGERVGLSGITIVLIALTVVSFTAAIVASRAATKHIPV